MRITAFLLLSFSFLSSNAQIGDLLGGFEKKKITSLEVSVNTQGGVYPGASLPIGFKCTDHKYKTYVTKNMNENGKNVTFESFNIKVKGGKFTNSNNSGSIVVGDWGSEFHYIKVGEQELPAIEIEVSNINYKGYSQTEKVEILLDFKSGYTFSYSGFNGKTGAEGQKGVKGQKGTDGKNGADGVTGGYGKGYGGNGGAGGNGRPGTNALNNAGRGGNGSRGGNGTNGSNARNVIAFANLVTVDSSGLELFRVVTMDESGEITGWCMQNIEHDGKINIYAIGGSGGAGGVGGKGGKGGHGGNGGDGGDGGKGGKGKKGKDGGPGGNGSYGGNGGNGGNGGDGGPGGNGGNGGNGGSITVYVFDDAIPYVDKFLALHNQGGAAGAAGAGGDKGYRGMRGRKGDGGKAGRGGYPGSKDYDTDHKGNKGSSGSAGADGAYGNYGQHGNSGPSGVSGQPGKNGGAPIVIKGSNKANVAWNKHMQMLSNANILDGYLKEKPGKALKQHFVNNQN